MKLFGYLFLGFLALSFVVGLTLGVIGRFQDNTPLVAACVVITIIDIAGIFGVLAGISLIEKEED